MPKATKRWGLLQIITRIMEQTEADAAALSKDVGANPFSCSIVRDTSGHSKSRHKDTPDVGLPVNCHGKR